MMASNADSGWIPDTHDDASLVDLEPPYGSRPNRWIGTNSSWRILTREDRFIFRSLEELRREDLAIHLYNVFSLKRQPRLAVTGGGEVKETTKSVRFKSLHILRVI
jgi:hypothetical protein